MSGFGIRRLVPSDLTTVDRILTTAAGYARLSGRSPVTIPDVRLSLFEQLIAENPEGNCVLVRDEHVIGVGFSQLWGSVGWISAVAVLPDFQGLGGGRRLLTTISHSLESAGAWTIGLDVPATARMSDALVRSGFEPNPPTFFLERPVGAQSDWRGNTITHEIWRAGANASWSELREFTGSFQRGFDPTCLLRMTDHLRLGNSVLFRRDGELVGLAVCHEATDVGRSATGALGTLHVPMLLVDTRQGNDVLDAVCSNLESLARSWRAATIRLCVPGRYVTALNQLLSLGYRTQESYQRATQMGHPDACPADLVNGTLWS